MRVSFQGEHGAYSEEAAIAYFNTDAEFDPCRSLREVFDKVADGRSDNGVVPAENSIEGIVTQTYDLLFTTNIKIAAEVIHRIRHCLVALPNVTLSNLEVIYSHPQALAQCQNFLEKTGIRSIAANDTAGSAKMIREKSLNTAAAVASFRAARVYDLNILASDIQDFPENLTRFFILSKDASEPTGNDKTSIVFGVRHEPGLLVRALKEFADRGLNLTKIESRPVKSRPWEYHFYLDFEGHQRDSNVRETLAALEKATSYLKILGSYPYQAATRGSP